MDFFQEYRHFGMYGHFFLNFVEIILQFKSGRKTDLRAVEYILTPLDISC